MQNRLTSFIFLSSVYDFNIQNKLMCCLSEIYRFSDAINGSILWLPIAMENIRNKHISSQLDTRNKRLPRKILRTS